MRTGIEIKVTGPDIKRLAAIVEARGLPHKHVWRARVILLTTKHSQMPLAFRRQSRLIDQERTWRAVVHPKFPFILSVRLEALSREDDPPEYFGGWLVEWLDYGDGAEGVRTPFDSVMMFKALILQA